MATNTQLIEEALTYYNDFEYDGENLKTFNEWAKVGMIVKKGETAFLKLDLWKPFTKKLVDEKTGEKIIDEKTGKQKEETRFMLKSSALFTPDQVEKGELKKKAPAKKKKNTFTQVKSA
ncbi:hypothetical protein QFZ31_006696 [Neobacillus niacini]|uniref:ArdC-like ssDNA-binding domain-containing protein n=1 Tax=Neobacillus driksii TaxID=3035913 RepID=UPI0027810015|nr:ArdC-like ssDNA-binding domain-containing protein [Neobacillus niacini]MDQ0976644.1 hypothetical protein [Neobacillus niacini]